MAPVKRAWIGVVGDWLAAWFWKLLPAKCSYTIDRMQIPIGDGVYVVADLYQPFGVKSIGTLLVRLLYGIGSIEALRYARIFAARRYQVSLSGCRGIALS
jgi:predicted acyl esterase